jgi:GT2 family glycosyltransferase
MEAEVDVVIVNWNAGTLLRKCLESIATLGVEIRQIRRVIVVDNGSVDGSVGGLPDCGGRLEVVQCSQNYGFARACNIGARLAAARYVLFLNPDTELKSGVLPRAIKAAEDNDNEPSVVGVKMVGTDDAVMKTCARFPTAARMVAASVALDRLFPSLFSPHLMLEWDHGSTRLVDQVIGAFFLVRAARFQELGGFDERFFMYYEELDYCVRAAKEGRRALHLGDVAIRHIGRGTSQQIGGIAIFYSARSKIIYSHKHFRFLSFLLVAAVTLTLEFVARIVGAGIRLDRREIGNTLVAFRYLWQWAATGRPTAEVQSDKRIPTGR